MMSDGSVAETPVSERGVSSVNAADDHVAHDVHDNHDSHDVHDNHDSHDVHDDHDSHDVHDDHDGHDVHDLQQDAVGQDGDNEADGDSDDGDGDEDADEGPDDARSWFIGDLAGPTDGPRTPALKLGVIGCGVKASRQHLPRISSHSGTTITAISDLSRQRVRHLGDRYGVSNRYQRGSTLITEHRGDLDGVVICSPPHTHAELAAQALDAGLATFVESPLAITPDDAWELQGLVNQSGVPAMVGYTRRYDPAYHQFEAALDRSDSVRYVDAYDVTPADPLIGRIASNPITESLPTEVAIDVDRIGIGQAKEALDTEADWIAEEYLSHLGRLCHHVNLLRGRFGDVAEIHHASLDGPWEFLTAELGYEGGPDCHLTSGRTAGEWSEEYVRVDTADRMVRLDCSDLYRGLSPSSVTIKDGTEEVVTATHVPTTDEPLTRQFRSFIEAMRTGTPTSTPFSDAAKDVELIAELLYRGTTGADGSQ